MSAEQQRSSGVATDRVLTALAVVVALAWLIRLVLQASGAAFFTDECFHAYVSEWMLKERRFPTVFPEFYSGFAYYYHPLFHLAGAAWAALLGLGALKYFNVAVSAAILVSVFAGATWLVRRGPRASGAPNPAARWATLMIVASPALAVQAVRHYAEALITLLTVVCAVLLVAWVERNADGERHGAAADRAISGRTAALGGMLGLALLTKFTALALLVLLALAAIVLAARGARTRASGLAFALGVALAIAAPWFVRNALVLGSPLYPAFAPDLNAELYRLNALKFSAPALAFYERTLGGMGYALPAAVFATLAVILVRRRRVALASVTLWALAVIALTPLAPMPDPRHANPVLPVLALAAALLMADALASRAAPRFGVDLVLLAFAVMGVASMPEYRSALNVPPRLLEAYEAVRTHVQPGERGLSLWTYDTFYYARRPATWPIPWGQANPPIDLFYERDPVAFLAELRAHEIGWVLCRARADGPAFDGANYPASFIAAMGALVEAGEIEPLWQAGELVLVRVKPAPGAALGEGGPVR